MNNLFKTKTLIIALIVGFVGLSFGPDLFAASNGDKIITITYNPNGDPKHPDTGPFIFNPYELVVEKDRGNVQIRLKIVSEGFSFPDDADQAITFHPEDGNFKVQGLAGKNKIIKILDKNRIAMTYKYDVVIINDASGEEYRIDPRIENKGGGN